MHPYQIYSISRTFRVRFFYWIATAKNPFCRFRLGCISGGACLSIKQLAEAQSTSTDNALPKKKAKHLHIYKAELPIEPMNTRALFVEPALPHIRIWIYENRRCSPVVSKIPHDVKGLLNGENSAWIILLQILHFPMQNWPKMTLRTSSLTTFPVISPT